MASSIDFFAGCVGGAAGVIIGHPLDTIKVVMQTSTHKTSAMAIARQTSLFQLYKGINAPLSGLAAINAIIFGVHGSIMKFVPDDISEKRRIFFTGASGSVAGLAQSLISCPMELVKTRAQLTQQPVLQCFFKTFRSEGGIGALYRGFGMTLLRDVPAFATYFVSYDLLLSRLQSSKQSSPSTSDLLLAGGTAGALSWLIIYPIDVVKSRIQADLRYNSTRECIRDALEKEGPRVFMRGCSPTLIRAFPTNAATFAVVAWTLYMYETYKAKNNQTSPLIID